MSDKGRSRTDDGGGRGGGSGGGGANEDDGEPPAETEDLKCKGCERKGKMTSFFRLRKSKKLRHQKRNQRGVSVNSGCFCLKRPRTLDSSDESPTSDPNSSEFTFDMLRALIENNDFYSKECNPHLDAVRENTW